MSYCGLRQRRRDSIYQMKSISNLTANLSDLCFLCESCWMYCQVSAIKKPAEKGRSYDFKMEYCDGCKKCAEECPCGYIEMFL